MTERRPRIDAQRSRAAILGAAREVLLERGTEVPMYEIARRASVGQGTLYRHFASFTPLAAALYADALDGFERMATERAGDPEVVHDLVGAAIDNQVRLAGVVAYLRAAGDGEPELRLLLERGSALFAEPLARGIEAGVVREGLGVDDVMTLLAMVEGVLHGVVGLPARQRAAGNAHRLLRLALRPEPAR